MTPFREFEAFAPYPNITLESDRVHPFLQGSAKDALWAASRQVPLEDGTPMLITSAFRTIADQYVLWRSAQAGGCADAARPGASNHQFGLAIDIDNRSVWHQPLVDAGCVWLGAGDPVHYDCPGEPKPEDAIIAFQRLWNLNHPDEPLEDDGAYGPATEAALRRTPLSGFAVDGCTTCEQRCDGDFLIIPDCRRLPCTTGCTEERFEAQCVDTPQPEYIDPWLRNRIEENANVTYPPPKRIKAPSRRVREAVLDEGCAATGRGSSWLTFGFIALLLRRRVR